MPETAPRPDAPDSLDQKSLWRNPDFLKIWAAQSTSNLGRLMSVLPLVAILVLDARPYQMAIIGGASAAAGLTFGLIAGVVAELAGLRVALAMGSIIWLVAGLVLLHPAIRNLRDMPAEIAGTDTTT